MYKHVKDELQAVCQLLTACEEMPDNAFLSVVGDKGQYFVMNDTRFSLRELTEEHLVVVDREGHVLEGDEAGVDPYFAVHRVLYECNPTITTVVHPRSRWNSMWAQLGRPLSPVSFLYCRYFSGETPCTGSVTLEPGEDLYTVIGQRVEEAFAHKGIPSQGAVIVCNDSALVWGKDAAATVKRAIALEEICYQAMHTMAITRGGDRYVAWEVSQELFLQD